ncbi:MAG: thiol-disulfide oxidoreductase DCC family protein [Nitrospinota bacterium]
MSNRQALLLWDGECGFCRRCVEWVEARDVESRIRPLPYQEAPSPPMTEELRARCQRAVVLLLPDDKSLSAGRAVLAVLSLLGWRKTVAALSLPPFVWAVEAGYWIVARNRGRVSRALFRA